VLEGTLEAVSLRLLWDENSVSFTFERDNFRCRRLRRCQSAGDNVSRWDKNIAENVFLVLNLDDKASLYDIHLEGFSFACATNLIKGIAKVTYFCCPDACVGFGINNVAT
jgi:hypothetical protein